MTSTPAQLRSQIAVYNRRISRLDAFIDRKLDEHDAMMEQVGQSSQYEVVLKAQLDRTLKPAWDEVEALSEKVRALEDELEALGG